MQKAINFVEKNEPPEELRDYFEAFVAISRLMVRFGEEHRSLSVEDNDAWFEDPETVEAFKTLMRAEDALDDAVNVTC